MNILMAGIDYEKATIDVREKISFNPSKIREIIKNIKQKESVLGVILLCTCNRTEIYISTNSNENIINPVELLCEHAKVDIDEFRNLFFTKSNEEAVLHLMEVSCGIHSMIFGEDQIISQIHNSLKLAMEEKTSNSILNTLFRYAITCGKKVKTNVSLKKVSPSVAKKVSEILEVEDKNKEKGKILVIGNGEVGRSVCEELIAEGYQVYITLRAYKHGKTIVPKGCETIDYEARQDFISQVDALISATSSPHHTVTYKMLIQNKRNPKYIFDLAVPRDIESEVGEIEGISLFNIDTIGKAAYKDNTKEMIIVNRIIEEQMVNFQDWFVIHKFSKDISLIKNLTINKISGNINNKLSEDEKIEKAISKTVDLMIYGLKNDISYSTLSNIKSGILSRR